MKNIFFVFALILSFHVYSQSNDLNRIVLNAFVIDHDSKLPQEAKQQLQTKLEQISSENGIGADALNPRFVLSAKINTTTKDIIAGPPQMVALNSEIVFFIGDAIDNQVFISSSINAKGIGINENKALINAIQQISAKNKIFTDLVNVGKSKIVNYYTEKCGFITQRAKTLSQQQKYDEAIYELMQVPEVCKACYERCMTFVQPIFQAKIDRESTLALNQSKTIWNSKPNSEGANEIAKLLASIDPSSAVYKDALALSEVVRKKIEADEKREWDFKMQKYADAKELDQQKLEAIREVAVKYFQNQPKTIFYKNIIW